MIVSRNRASLTIMRTGSQPRYPRITIDPPPIIKQMSYKEVDDILKNIRREMREIKKPKLFL